MLRRLLFVALGLTLSGCSEPGLTNISYMAAPEPQRKEELPRPKEKSFNGWGPFTFGMNFADALTAYPGVVWDAESVRKCRVEMPLRGCTLSPAQGSRVPPTAGVAMLPMVVFNEEGRLATIRLRKFLKGTIKRAQCERVYGHLLAYLRETWGSPTATSLNKHGMPKRSTLQGREFFLGTDYGAVVGREIFNVQPDGRHIILLSRYIGATDLATAVCHLSIYYIGPESLQPPPEERPHPLKNWY